MSAREVIRAGARLAYGYYQHHRWVRVLVRSAIGLGVMVSLAFFVAWAGF